MLPHFAYRCVILNNHTWSIQIPPGCLCIRDYDSSVIIDVENSGPFCPRLLIAIRVEGTRIPSLVREALTSACLSCVGLDRKEKASYANHYQE